jgi:hypothetical protein
MTNHPITPPPELVQQWLGTYFGSTVTGEVSDVELVLATQAARWGSDQELEACVNWLIENQNPRWAHVLHSARRPKPPTLKEQALKALKVIEFEYVHSHSPSVVEATTGTIRRALEALPND